MTHHSKKFIVLAGGLTGGPVKPLLAIAKVWQENDPAVEPVLFDVKNSTGHELATNLKIKFQRIVTGKLRRYFSLKNIFFPFLLCFGFFQAILALRKLKPIAVLGAGGFVQIPVIYAAWVLRIPRFIHQQDVYPTLSNQLCNPVANLVTTTFEISLRDFFQGSGLGKKYVTSNKVYWTGNPVYNTSKPIPQSEAKKKLGLTEDLPVMLVLGGGSGAMGLNQKIIEALPELENIVQIIHSTGPGKQGHKPGHNYHPFEFIEDMDTVYSAADYVFARAGIGTLSELAEHKKVSIIVPMPRTHQEFNAEYLFKIGAVFSMDQEEMISPLIVRLLRKLMFKPDMTKNMSENLHRAFPQHADQKIFKLIKQYLDGIKHKNR